ncbi:hypothetical protein [Pseudomonas monteilii]|uniref:hypothetical protein n=1 Tax=Pseudomonas monteilii TaxID=76759 RepID=UPI00036206CE|nr:hypothetical protein [Pseudomonas monteilii]
MDTNKIREQFEAAYLAESTRRNGRTYPSVLTRGDDGNYVIPSVQSAWWAWQASREALVVDLRERFPLLSAEGLSESDHHCEWSIQQDRKRLHAALDSAQGNANSEVGA